MWEALRLPPWRRPADGGCGTTAGPVLLDEAAQATLAKATDRLPPGDTLEVVLSAEAPLLSLPVELVRLAGAVAEVGTAGAAGRVERLPQGPQERPGRWQGGGNELARTDGVAGPAEDPGGGSGAGSDQDAESAA